MTALEVTKILLIDVRETVDVLEQKYGRFFVPNQSGYYLPGQAAPAMVEGKYYYFMDPRNGQEIVQTVVTDIASVQGHIYDQDGEIVVPEHRLKQLMLAPSFSFRAMNVIVAYVQHVLSNCSEWAKYEGFGKQSATDIISMFFNKEIQLTMTSGFKLDLAEAILADLMDVRNMVVDFIDGDKWTMCFTKVWNDSILVEKTTDYRIHVWEREHKKK